MILSVYKKKSSYISTHNSKKKQQTYFKVMNSSTTASAISNIGNYYIVCSLSAGFGLISIILSLIIIIIIRRTKPRLHTVRHLLICNTCIGSIVYCIIQTINYIILIFLPWISSDISCRWRGYFGYVSISAATYSYLVQAISRLLFSVFSTKYPWVITFKVHYILILIHWIFILIIPLSAIITHDIYFRPGLLCWVPMKYFIHVLYTAFAYYVLPIISIMIIYVYIYQRIQNIKKRTELIRNTTSEKRDLEVLRNIIILLFIYISGGIPTLLYLTSTMDVFYLASIVTFTFVVMIEKICTVLLDRELRLVVKNMVYSRNRVMPFENSITRQGDQEHVVRFQRT